jgi:hypothetical protein
MQNAKMQKCKNAKMQKCKNAKMQKFKKGFVKCENKFKIIQKNLN